MTIELVHADLLATVAELRDVASTLEAERRRTDLAVDVLLDGGWSGRAASAYLAGWDEWRTGCDQVLAVLSSMAELIAASRADQVEQDAIAAAALRALAGELLAKVDGARP
ncbi:WXG100 family type VII secretion target [Nocardioides rubriscoriae]|uniref:WXG100 family type VII secretion target n=1 Tax=Nocardioides rubriscoriae TaxID=642762 RepID=UPI0011E04545|nr:WXG100 family type VII secretion target [Nocardioides rubriscoriae]